MTMTENLEKSEEICVICGENKTRIFKNPFSEGQMKVHVRCFCQRKIFEDEENKRKEIEKLKIISELKSSSNLGKRYQNINFENTKATINTDFSTAFNRCKRYCEIHEKVLEGGLGIYLFGSKGIGKTHLVSCIANDLIKSLKSVMFTSLFDISSRIKETFNKNSKQTERSIINKFLSSDFLIFDDLGTEIFTKNQEDTWLQNLIYELVNARYNGLKPMIFTSNYSVSELVNNRGLSDRTADRINGMCTSIKITGNSLRNSINTTDLKF